MALKNQNNKILKVHHLYENTSLKENKKKLITAKPWNKYSGKRDTSIFNTKFFHNVSQPR